MNLESFKKSNNDLLNWFKLMIIGVQCLGEKIHLYIEFGFQK